MRTPRDETALSDLPGNDCLRGGLQCANLDRRQMDLAGWSRTKGGTTTEAGHRLAPDGCDPLGVANLAANSVLLTELATEVDDHDAPPTAAKGWPAPHCR
jgi:hypothetical protein